MPAARTSSFSEDPEDGQVTAPKLLSIPAAAKASGLQPRQIRQAIRDGKLALALVDNPAGRRTDVQWYVPAAALDRYVALLEQAGARELSKCRKCKGMRRLRPNGMCGVCADAAKALDDERKERRRARKAAWWNQIDPVTGQKQGKLWRDSRKPAPRADHDDPQQPEGAP